MFRYIRIMLVVVCSLLFLSSTAVASNVITPDTKSKLRIQTIAMHGEIAIFETRVGNWGKILMHRASSRFPQFSTYLVVLENEAYASVFKDTIAYLNYRTRYKTQKGLLFYLNPIEPISPMVMSEILEQGFTRNAKMFLMNVKSHNLQKITKANKK